MLWGGSIWIFWARTYMQSFTFVRCGITSFAEGWGGWTLGSGRLYCHTGTQHASYITSSAWTVWLMRVTPLQRTLMRSEQFAFLMEAHEAPQCGALPPRSRTSAIKRQLWPLPRFPGVSQSPWTLPLLGSPWSAELGQAAICLVLAGGHALKLLHLAHSGIDGCHFMHKMKYFHFSTSSSSTCSCLQLWGTPRLTSMAVCVARATHCMLMSPLSYLFQNPPPFYELFSIKFQYLRSSLLFCIFYCTTIR